MKAEVGEYKGSAVISLPLGESGKFWFTFGVSKAKAILASIDDIRDFVDKNEKKGGE